MYNLYSLECIPRMRQHNPNKRLYKEETTFVEHGEQHLWNPITFQVCTFSPNICIVSTL